MQHRAILGMTGLVLVMALAGCEREPILPGERFPVRADLDASVPVEGEAPPVAPADRPENRAEPIALPAAQANADWTHRGGNARHAAPHGVLSAAPQRVWSVSIGSGNSRRNRIAAAPVVAGGRIFAIDAGARLTAVTTGGAVAWQADLTPEFDRNSDLSGGGLAFADGRLYATTGYGELLAIDPASGGVTWRQRLDASVTGAPAAEGGRVYVTARDGSGYAVSGSDGRVLWRIPGTPGAAGVTGGAAPSVGPNAILFPFAGGEIGAALKDEGAKIWNRAVTGQRLGRAFAAGVGDVTGDPVVVGETAYAGTAAGRTVAFSAVTGERFWSVGEGALNPPLVVGGSVFVVNDEARLVRLDAATGEVIWAADMPFFVKDKPKRLKAVHAHYGPVLAGGRLVVASSDGVLRLFDPRDGSLVGQADIPGGAATSPALAGGVLYVVGGNGQLHAFR